jgi:hypothetical protein
MYFFHSSLLPEHQAQSDQLLLMYKKSKEEARLAVEKSQGNVNNVNVKENTQKSPSHIKSTHNTFNLGSCFKIKNKNK